MSDMDTETKLQVIDSRLDGTASVQEQLEQRLDDLEAENRDLREEVVELRSTVDDLVSIMESDGGKEQKVRDILHYAVRKRNDQPVVIVKPGEVRGATGCSRRYSYDLIDELPTQREWLLSPDEMQQYGSLEIDTDAQDKRMGVDFEGVHGDPAPVNKFTTGTTGSGGEE